MKRTFLFIFFLTAGLSITILIGRSFRVNKIPNGSVNTCSNCHNDPNGGGARNAFGQEIEKSVTPGGTESFWGPALASMDSDGDGFTNGEELQDPNGTWTEGTANPGNSTLVTNPGDPNSHPPITAVEDELFKPNSFALHNNFPNPFNPSTKITFDIPNTSNVRLDIFNSLGEYIITLVNQNYSPGKYVTVWNGRNSSGNQVNSGVYIYRLTTNNFTKSKRMVLLK